MANEIRERAPVKVSYSAGNKHVMVPCDACDPTGKITVVNRKLEAERVTCPSCRGKKQISVNRLPK
jgi:DnaJ-class molecular chaperone